MLFQTKKKVTYYLTANTFVQEITITFKNTLKQNSFSQKQSISIQSAQ